MRISSNQVSAILKNFGVKDYTSPYAHDIKNNPGKLRVCLAVFKRAEELIKAYDWILTPALLSVAKNLRWERHSVKEYECGFFANVIANYRIWEITPEEFQDRYEFVANNNPEWSYRFLEDAIAKCKRAKIEYSPKLDYTIEKLFRKEKKAS